MPGVGQGTHTGHIAGSTKGENMKKRILSIICIMFLLFTISSPLTGSVFTYADEPQQEQLSQDEVIKAAIALYLNERKAWITSTTSAPIDAVQAQMQIWIDTYDFWTNHTTIGSAAEFYAQCVVKYNPFRISLKGPAVRALNDLYNWLIDTGKLPNLESDNQGGETTDNLYTGLEYSGELFTIVTTTYSNNLIRLNKSDVKLGSKVSGISSDILMDWYCNKYNITISQFNSSSSNFDLGIRDGGVYPTYNIQYYSDVTLSVPFVRDNSSYGEGFNYNLRGYPNTGASTNVSGIGGLYFSPYAKSGQFIGFPTRILTINNSTGINKIYNGFVAFDSSYCYVSLGSTVNRNDQPNINNASVNFDTDNFNKTDPTPPEGDDEVTYTPEDKTTGDTYNTYNEYISNYVTKNTVINNNYEEPEQPGGTTPPWDGGDTTVTPDGDGFNLNLPDLTLPDLDIDWSINGLTEKFPFSIPWDLMAFFTVLNAEPETPSIQATIDLGIVDWDIDWDLHNFDTLAVILRNLEFIGFCLALILITRSIIKG